MSSLPVIDVAPLLDRSDSGWVATLIREACRKTGFFYITGHGLDPGLLEALEDVSRMFFALSMETKMQYRMALGGRAWRGYFPVGDELTSGNPDLKEGIYFGAELPESDPRVRAGVPMHGANLFPAEVTEMRNVILQYLGVLTDLGHQLMRGISLSLGLKETYFGEHYTSDPLILFRIFHYPPQPAVPETDQWGVGEHTDYGLLTILKQDAVGGLQVKSKGGWIDAPYLPGTFVCNIGDMLDRLTGGYYKSTPHRVLNTSGKGRFSFPFFFDPNFNAQLEPVPLEHPSTVEDDADERWDKSSVHAFEGTYGDYLLDKVAKVFPELGRKTL
jgi:isopenicillin N synthase-like dioxygenase